MANKEYIEIVRGTSIAPETQILACNYSNAINTFRGHSIIMGNYYENREYKKFLKLKEKWEKETMFLSSSSAIYNNSSYIEIIALGEKSIPWIIRDLKKTNKHWFSALNQISGENPVPEEHYGIIPQMKEDWINWAKAKHYDFE